jgi:HAD superfamily phosphoserine phosphatase-like hydrolase
VRALRLELLTAKIAKAARNNSHDHLFMTTSLSASVFIESILQLRPTLAVFDCDGTLWSGDLGERFFDWELRSGIFADETLRRMRSRYAEYKEGKISEDDMCGEMVTLHTGMREQEVLRLSDEFFNENFVQQIFPEMRQLVQDLQNAGCDVWAVSSTNEWTIRAAMKHFAISDNKILAAVSHVKAGIITDRIIRLPSGPGKPKAIRHVIQRTPDAAFGNSRWDVDMLRIAAHPVAINPNPDLEQLAREQGWMIYHPLQAAVRGTTPE